MTLPPPFLGNTEAGRKAQEKWHKEEQIRQDTGTTFYDNYRKFREEQLKNSADAPTSPLQAQVGQAQPAIGSNIMDRAPVGQVQEQIEGTGGTLYTFGGAGYGTRANAEAARQKVLNARSKPVAKQQGWLTQPNQSGGQSDLPYNVQNTPSRPGQPTIQTGQNIIPKSTTTTTNTSAPTNSVPDLFSRIPGTPENIKRASPDAVGSGTPEVGFDPIITEVFDGSEGPQWLVKNPFTGQSFGQFWNKNEAIQVAERSGGLNMTGNSGASSGVVGDGSYPGGPTYIIPGYDPTQFEGGSEQIRRAEAEGRLGIPALPPVPEMRLAPEMEARQEKELLSEKGLQVGEQSALQAAQARSDTGAIATRPSDTRPELSVATSTAVEDITSLDPSQIIGGPSAIVQAAQGTLDNKLAIAATREMDVKATVQYQLGELGKTIKDGQPLPAWASGAARAADAFALKRGLGASSMAVHARTLALQESGIDIAKADAESYRRLQELNLSNAQQTVITNANNLAALEKENLDSRLSASVDNARNALSIDLGNLTSRQRASELSFQQYTQKLFTDAAAVNAASQFNAKSKNDVDSFFASLDQSTANMNANRVEAIERDNAKQKNSMTEFYEAQKLSRDTFNVNTMANIRAANTKWYQSVATIQNSNQMLANSYAAQSELGLRSTEYNALWQKRRDDAQMLYDSTERDLDRVAQVAAASAAMAQQAALARSSQKASKTSAIFSTIGTIAGAAVMLCWVAREVYGSNAPEVYRFRWWLEKEAPKWFNRLYKKRGEKFAYFIKDKPILKKLIKVWMDTKVKRVEKTWRLNRLNPA
tara:strand:+ start:144 stop:2600 length:2457 start_codon:yes stop_codon:yes gene_type:complete